MKALNTLILISALIASTSALANPMDDAVSEGRSTNVDECLNGDCPQKRFGRPATQNVQYVDAVYNSLMSPGATPVELGSGTAVKED